MRTIAQHRLYIFINVVILTLLTSSAWSQEAEENIVRVSFSVYSIERLEGIKFLHGDKLGATDITFYSSARSQTYEYIGPNPIIFYREVPAPTAEFPERVQRTKVAELSIPLPGGEYLFLFFNSNDPAREPYRIYPLEDSTKAHPYGSIRLFNASPFLLNGVIGNIRIELPQGPSDSFRVKGNLVSVGLGFFHEEKFLQSFKSPLRCSASERGLLMLFPPHVKGSSILQTRYIRQSKPEEVELEAASEDRPKNENSEYSE